MTTWEAFIGLARHDGTSGDAAVERDALQQRLQRAPDREWFLNHPDAHMLAPALARAIFHAEERANGRRFGRTPYRPPRLDAEARDDDTWNREWVSVVLTDDNDVAAVRHVPDFGAARSVVGLDAHPALPVWQTNTVPWIDTREVLSPEERRLWRRYERGLRVVQVGEATRPLTSGEYFDHDGARALATHLREEYGSDFRTAITAAAVEDDLRSALSGAGVADPETMHYGEEKSRNDFTDEAVGWVEGCIDPGDDYVLDLLAELGLDAEPERSEDPCPRCEGDGCHECDGTGYPRAHGRGFVGPDAEAAEAILASVRETHVAQAAGRYARAPTDPADTATVFVRTDALPPGFADLQVAGIEWVYSDTQEAIVRELREAGGGLTARRLADRVGCSKRHVHETLDRLQHPDGDERRSAVQALDGEGDHGATLYRDDGTPTVGVVNLGGVETTNGPVLESYTWVLAIRDPDVGDRGQRPTARTSTTRPTETWVWRDAGDPGG